jgi:biotin carboxyl carrier protein
MTVEAPMPGTVLDILVAPGDAVSEGDPLLILEAMKMENEIVAPQAGTVDAVLTEKGAAVNAGDALVSLK